MYLNPFLATDGYKTGHYWMYPKGTTLVYSNWTPRHGKHSNVENSEGVVVFGTQMVMKMIHNMFDEAFFKRLKVTERYNTIRDMSTLVPNIKEIEQSVKKQVCQEIKEEYSMYLGTDYDVSHIEALWDLGYLPIEVKALPEGSFCPYGVPALTIKNTLPEFFWLTNFLETLISNLLWLPMTSATSALDYKRTLISACKATDKENIGFVDFQGHDFSMRGMGGLDATMLSGLGHAAVFQGSDSLPVIKAARTYYNEKEFVVGSVNATEHSVMCAGTKGDEIGTFKYLMKQFPTGILSIVSDTWDLWKVITEYLPELKEEILERDGKIVIRPDSGDPVDIICGLYHTKFDGMVAAKDYFNVYPGSKIKRFYVKDKLYNRNFEEVDKIVQEKGVIELLWDIFGGTVNEQGYKVLDSHIGAIYGDSITPDRAKEICGRLEAKGFASTNIVLGIGSYTYQYVTRDTHGFAMKATYVEIKEIDQEATKKLEMERKSIGAPLGYAKEYKTIGREIFKDPVTGDGSKKSARGLLAVDSVLGQFYELHDQVSWEQEKQGALETIFKDGKFTKEVTLTEIRSRINRLI